MTRAEILERVDAERERAEVLRAGGLLEWTAADPACPDLLRLAALVEEVGEVARAVHDGDGLTALRDELVQVAAVAVAWCEGLRSV